MREKKGAEERREKKKRWGRVESERKDEMKNEVKAKGTGQEEKNTRNYFAISSSSSIFNYDRQSKQMQNPSRVFFFTQRLSLSLCVKSTLLKFYLSFFRSLDVYDSLKFTLLLLLLLHPPTKNSCLNFLLLVACAFALFFSCHGLILCTQQCRCIQARVSSFFLSFSFFARRVLRQHMFCLLWIHLQL